jgi:mannosyltransferase
LATESLWLDELISTSFANDEDSWAIIERSQTDPNFPTYYLFLHYWVVLFGDSEFSLRFPSALSGVLAVLAIYMVGRRLFGYGTGLMAALILAFSPFHIFYSQETRVYALMALLGLLSFYFFLKVLKERTLTGQVGYVLCTSLLLYSHVYSLFTLLAQNIYFFTTLWLARRASKSRDHDQPDSGRQHRAQSGLGRDEARLGLGRWAVLQGFLFALYIPGLVLVYRWLSDPIASKANSWIEPPSLVSIYYDLLLFLGSSSLLLVLFISLVLAAAIGLLRSRAGGSEKLYLLLLWLLIPLVLPIAISIFFTPIFVERHAIVATLALYLLAAKGGVAVAKYIAARSYSGSISKALKVGMIGLIAAALIVLSSEKIWFYYNTVDKTQWREAVQYLNTNVQPHDLILLYPSWAQLALEYYYYERDDVETAQGPHTDMATEPVPSILADIEEHNRVWVVRDQAYQPDQLFPNTFFEKSHTSTYHEQYRGVDLSLYEKRSTQD